MTAPGRSQQTWVGVALPRREDPRLVSGRGRFVDDLEHSAALFAAFVRSPSAAAEITAVDLTRVTTVDGVRGAFSAADLGVTGLTALLEREDFVATTMPILARDSVRYVGEPVAIVLAEDQYAAEDGTELAAVEFAPRQPVTSTENAEAEGAPRVHAELAGNAFIDVTPFNDDVDEIFENAACVVQTALRSGRQYALPLEPRGCLAEWVDRDDQLVVHISTQVPHQVRSALARCLGLHERQVRVIVPDVGGGFGLKCVIGREEIAVAAAALRTRRPVKWIEDRREGLLASFHGRQQHYRARAAFDGEGRILALDADIRCDVGAYSVFPFTSGVEPLMAATELPGAYKVPRYRARARAVATNKAPTAPYRGVSRPQIVLVMERLMERAARRLGLDSVEVRRRNLIDTFPYVGVNGITYDPGSYQESLELCHRRLREEGWFQLREDPHRLVGVGFACFNERTGYGTEAFAQRKMSVVPGYDLSEVRMDPSGTVTVVTGTSAHGQGHETTLAQIAADQLGVHPDAVRIRQGDTDLVSYGWGTFASRSAAIGGAAVRLAATTLADRIRTIAAHLLEADDTEIELDDGWCRLRDDSDRAISIAEVAEVAYLRADRLPKNLEPGLSAHASFDVLTSGTFSNATHGVVAELDQCTGQTRLLRYVVVEDCGVVINPPIVDGQVRGGVAQGIAAALYEEIRYDADGQATTGSLIDYLVPTAAEIPDIDVEHLETPCAFTETGAKGMGEGGTIGAPAAVLNAVNDALRHTGAELDAVPITPEQVHRALERR
jgi:carbon-monoxide dehydrogenase large subunit